MSRRFRGWASSRRLAWAAASYFLMVLAVAAITLLVTMVEYEFATPNVSVLYLLVVLCAAYWLGTGQAVLAMILALLAFDEYFGQPPRSLLLGDPREVASILMLAVASLAGILLTQMTRGRERHALALASANARLYQESVVANAEAHRHLIELNALLDNLIEGVTIVDGAGRVLLFNETGKRVWRAPERPELWTEEWLRSRDFRHVDGRPMAIDEWPLSRALRGERFAAYEVLHIDPEGKRHYLMFSGSAVRNEQGQVVMAINVYHDVTQIRDLERIKDEFLEVAAHELKTPVAVLKGYAQGLQRAPDVVTEPYRRALEAIDRQLTRIDALVRDLLDVSRLRAGTIALQRDRIDISELAEAVANQAALRSHRHRINLDIPGPIFVVGDRGRLEQVLNRLLDNAIRYSPGGGEVDVAVRREDSVPRGTFQTPRDMFSRVRISVVDRGVGIAQEKQSHIFERFYRAHTGTPYDYGGMGVGLYIAREIIRSHNGEMGFSSLPGKGSTFYFTLPLE